MREVDLHQLRLIIMGDRMSARLGRHPIAVPTP
jgi:hypothetical protein